MAGVGPIGGEAWGEFIGDLVVAVDAAVKSIGEADIWTKSRSSSGPA